MKIKVYFISCILLFAGHVSLFGQATINATIALDSSVASYSPTDTLSFNVNFSNSAPVGTGDNAGAISAANTANNFVISDAKLVGTDIYGNDVSVDFTINGGFSVGPASVEERTANFNIPADGTLHDITLPGYRIELTYTYNGAPSTTTISSPDSILIDVPANLEIIDLAYPSGTFEGGDIIQIAASVRNSVPDGTTGFVRPLLPRDGFRTTLYLTQDPSLDTNDDFRLGFYGLTGDLHGLLPISGQRRVRHVDVSDTPDLIDTFGRTYNPQPDDGNLDIDEIVTVRCEVMIPHNYVGDFFVAAETDSLNQIVESEEGVNATFSDQNDNFYVDNLTPLIKITSASSLDTLPVSEVTDTNGALLEQSDGLSDNPALSESGEWIVFHSIATNLDPNLVGAGNYNIYIRNRTTGAVELISRSNTGTLANADSLNPVISADGRYIAYESKGTNLVDGSQGATSQIYVYDQETERVERVSITSEGLPANGDCFLPSIDASGRIIVFESTATNLDVTYSSQLESNLLKQTFLHDRDVNGATTYSDNYATYLLSETNGNIANSDVRTPKISLDGDVVVFASNATNLDPVANGLSQIWMRNISNGAPSGNISLVSLNNAGGVAGNGASTEPAINGGANTPNYGLQIAFTSTADNLIADDTNNVADIFVSSFADPSIPLITRVSLSNPRASYGTITFVDFDLGDRGDNVAINQPLVDELISLNDGINPATTLVFGTDPLIADVLIGADVEETRSNLITAINNAPDLNIFAYASDPAGHTPSIMLYNTLPGAQGDQLIFTNSTVLAVSGMTQGGVETGALEDKYELGEVFGSLQPSLDRTGRTVAFRSLVGSISVANAENRFIKGPVSSNPTQGTPGIGEIIRTSRTSTSKIHYVDRDISNSGILDNPGNTNTVCASVNKFGYPTNTLVDTASSGSSRVPALSSDGRYIAFASESTNNGGLRFNRTNTQPLDTNNFRDVYLHARPSRADIINIDENQPFVVITNPSTGTTTDFTTPIYINAGAFGFDESNSAYGSAGVASVEFFVNGLSVGVDTVSPFSVLYQPTSDDNLRIIAKATDKRGNSTDSSPVLLQVEVTPFEKPFVMLDSPSASNGDNFTVGDNIDLKTSILQTAGSSQFAQSYSLTRVSYLVNGITIYSTDQNLDTVQSFDLTYAFTAPGDTSINAMVTYVYEGSTIDIFSETLSVNVIAVDVANNDRDFINDAFQRIVARAPRDDERNDGLQILNSSGQTRASYIATLLDSNSVETAQTASLIYRTMTGEWPDKEEMTQAIVDLRAGQGADANALTTALVPEYENRFNAINTKLGFMRQLFINKHGVSLTSQNQTRLYDTLIGAGSSVIGYSNDLPGYEGDNITFATQLAIDNDTSGLTGPNGLPLSKVHLYEMPNNAKDDLKIALAISAFLEVNPTNELIAKYSDMSLEQALEDIILEAYTSVPAALSGATSLGSDWYESSWFGMFAYPADSSNWIYSWRLGWVYVAPSGTPSGAWLYSSNLGAWLWSRTEINGYYYQAGRNTWVYMLPEGADSPGAWLNYMDTNQWQFVTP